MKIHKCCATNGSGIAAGPSGENHWSTRRILKYPSGNDTALREFIQEEKGDMFIAFPVETKLDELSSDTFFGSPDEIARFGFAVSGYLNDEVLALMDWTKPPKNAHLVLQKS